MKFKEIAIRKIKRNAHKKLQKNIFIYNLKIRIQSAFCVNAEGNLITQQKPFFQMQFQLFFNYKLKNLIILQITLANLTFFQMSYASSCIYSS